MRSRRNRDAITLLEVVLALAILAGAYAVLAQHVATGIRAAQEARELTRVQLFAESLMSEMTSGISMPGQLSGVVDTEPEWQFASSVESTQIPGMVRLVFLAQKPNGLEYRLVRLIRDPTLAIPEEPVTEEAGSTTEGTAT